MQDVFYVARARKTQPGSHLRPYPNRQVGSQATPKYAGSQAYVCATCASPTAGLNGRRCEAQQYVPNLSGNDFEQQTIQESLNFNMEAANQPVT